MPHHPIDLMTETQLIFIFGGYWCSYYETYDMKGVMLRTRYKLEPVSGESIPADGRHKAIVISNDILRVISGGELCGESIINFKLSDFRFEFDDQYHDDFKAGAIRGFTGKRACHRDFYYRQCDDWKFGYEEGRRARLEAIEKDKMPF
jgi:hypothetical protein